MDISFRVAPMSDSATTFYRPEIDGLRSLAVLPVIWFHAGFALFSGGFVGVDIFFVISGYLITTILAKEIAEGRFSILNFYERRARRILPALFLVIAATLPFAVAWMLDRDLSNLGRSIVAVAVFSSNLFFWKNNDYFDPAAAEQPLLHTWSLAVEEQYYIIFPLVLFLAWSLRRRALALFIFFAALGSLMLSDWGAIHHPTINFYMLPTRAWELLAGSFVAMLAVERGARHGAPWVNRPVDGLLALVGVAMIGYSIFMFDESTPFPSFYTLVPVLGSSLIILFASRHCVTGKLLSLKPLVAIGLVSYSAYLWHQPIFALYRLAPLQWGGYDEVVFSLLILAVFVLAWLSWRFVEKPFREKGRFSRNQILGYSFAGLAAMALTGGVLAQRYAVQEVFNPDLADCSFPASTPEAVCKRLGSGPRQVVIFGDSHALPMVDAFEKDDRATYTFISIPGCPPLVGLMRYDGLGNATNCDEPGEIKGYAEQVAQLHPDQLILVGHWTLYLHGWQKKNVLQRKHHLLQPEDGALTGVTNEQVVLRGLDATAAFFKERLPATRLYLLEQAPDIQMFGHVKSVAQAMGDRVPRAPIDQWDTEEQQLLLDAARQGGLQLIRTLPAFCDAQQCNIAQGKDYFYLDDNHLSPSGAKRLVAPLKAALGEARLGQL